MERRFYSSIHSSPRNIPSTALADRSDIGAAVLVLVTGTERKKQWAAERAAIHAEVARAKETVDLIRMARAFTKLDALEARVIEAVEKRD